MNINDTFAIDVSTLDLLTLTAGNAIHLASTLTSNLTNQTTQSPYRIHMQRNSSQVDRLILNSQMARQLLPVTIFVCILMCFGLLGNPVVVYVYLFRWKATSIKYFIGSLATLDLITSGLCMPLEIVFLTNPITANDSVLCRILRLSRAFTSMAAAFILLAIAVDRYMRVCKYTQTQMSVQEAKTLCVVSLPVAVCLSWPAFFVFGNFDRDTDPFLQTSCSTAQHLRGTIYPLLYYLMLFLIFIVVSACMFVFYLLVGVKLCRLRSSKSKRSISKVMTEKFQQYSSGHFSQDTTTDESRSSTLGNKDKNIRNSIVRKASFVDLSQISINLKSMRRRSTRIMKRQKITLILLLIAVLEFISFLPYVVLAMCKSFLPNFLESLSESQQVWYNIGLMSHFIGNAFNPFIYGFFSRNFRRKFMEMLQSDQKENHHTFSSGGEMRISTSK
ncbi:neuropeptide FF receptor 2-like [Ylistrum balloti]|uniref:neuropeptide FF receptor 2-like n=1 Tax=Ylistrum balloti TaxID=509963 RepID=UPI002905F591|nr:neuropeptide FF receptor 2-like [Ylistrum balloti]